MELVQKIREKLQESIDEVYQEFHTSLVPGLTNMLGVRMPKVREIAKWASGEDWQTVWEELGQDSYEELMIKGLLIGYGKLTQEEQIQYLKRYVPLINNWGICDCCCSTWKFMKKNQDEWLSFLQSYAKSDSEFEVRFAMVALLNYFVNENYLERLFQIFNETTHEGYYVKMAIAWAVSVCYVKFPGETAAYLENDRLDDFTHNKAIQKIRESFRVSKEDKEKLLLLRR